ncbi:MAG: DnaJ C-terminal domain-containing protein, partial [Sphingobacterium sp.]
VLTDPEKRKKYDQYGQNWKQGGSQHQTSNQQGKSGNEQQSQNPFEGFDFNYDGNYDTGEYSDFFEQMFGSRFGGSSGFNQRAAYRGNDFQTSLELTLQQAYRTHQQTFNVNGKNIRITIPAGIANGQKIKLKGQGGSGQSGGPNGDLYITFTILPHPEFTRKDNDLYTDIKVDLYTALLGGEILVNTLQDKIKVKIKPGTQSGSKIRLKQKGFPLYKKEGNFGDLYAKIQVELPTDLSKEEQALFQQLADLRK